MGLDLSGLMGRRVYEKGEGGEIPSRPYGTILGGYLDKNGKLQFLVETHETGHLKRKQFGEVQLYPLSADQG